MGRQRLRRILGLGLASFGGALATQVDATQAKATDWPFRSQHRSCDIGCLPNSGYQADRVVARTTIVATAGISQPVEIPNYQLGSSNERQAFVVARKSFFAERTTFVAGDVEIDRLGITLYSTGEIRCHGRLTLIGSASQANIRINMRALTSDEQGTGPIRNATLIWSTAKTVGLRQDRPSFQSLVGVDNGSGRRATVDAQCAYPPIPVNESPLSTVALDTIAHFDEISHVEIDVDRLSQR